MFRDLRMRRVEKVNGHRKSVVCGFTIGERLIASAIVMRFLEDKS
jgi:hypothetical protein